ncbi:MAG TPA: TolC family protein [Rhodopila sp.]|nr:TolC family protein [Rhodopila sp.]
MSNRFAALVAAGLMLAACSQAPGKIAPPDLSSGADAAPAMPSSSASRGAPIGEMIAASGANGSPSGEPTGPLTLQMALAQALLTNPDLGQFSYDIRSAEARTLQAGYRPNPEISVLSEDFGGSRNYAGFQGSQTTLSLSQLVELGGKRAARLRVARLDESLAAWNYEGQRLDVLTATTRAFVDVVVAQRKVDLAETTLRIDRQFQGGVSERVRAGNVSSLEERRAQVTSANGQIGLQQARHELEAARIRLAALWGSKAPQFARASGDPGEDILPPPPLPALLALAVRNPDVARWESEIAQREARVAVERSKNVPDVTIQAGPRYYGEGASAFVAGVGITLPAFGMNLGNQLDAQAQLAKSRLQKQSAEVRTAADIRRTYERLAAAYQAIKVLQQSGIPAAQAAYDGMSTGYRQGKFGLIDVLDAQRALLDARMRLLDAQATYHAALADVERLTGETLRTSAAGAKRPGAPS